MHVSKYLFYIRRGRNALRIAPFHCTLLEFCFLSFWNICRRTIIFCLMFDILCTQICCCKVFIVLLHDSTFTGNAC